MKPKPHQPNFRRRQGIRMIKEAENRKVKETTKKESGGLCIFSYLRESESMLEV